MQSDDLIRTVHAFIEEALMFPVNTSETVYARVVNVYGESDIFALRPEAQRLAIQLKRAVESAVQPADGGEGE